MVGTSATLAPPRRSVATSLLNMSSRVMVCTRYAPPVRRLAVSQVDRCPSRNAGTVKPAIMSIKL